MTMMKDGEGGTVAISTLELANHAHIHDLVHPIETNGQLWITTETTTGRSVVV